MGADMFKIRNDGKARVFFDSITGLKIRHAEGDYSKSTYPELVDVKITDYCPYKCSFCYQASLPDGKHGDLDYIKASLDTLAAMGTFEIAYGGGEPAEHPNFAEILDYTTKVGMVPNFTAFGTSWMKNEEILESVKRNVGGIGVSVHDVASVGKYHRIKEKMKGGRAKVMMQHVFGTKGFEETVQLAAAVDHVLFLGYKTVGFGNKFQPNKFTKEEVSTIVKACKKLSVDTAFVDAYGDILQECGVKASLIASPEGKFSCYIDAVEKTMAPSSYVKKDEMKPLKSDNAMFENLKKEYATW